MSQTWQTFDEDAGGTSVHDALIYQRTRTVSLATMFSGTSAPTLPTPVDGSPWVDTTVSAKKLKIYLDSAWREVCVLGYSQLTTAEIGDATITTAKLVDANVTTAKIAADAVTAAKVADDAIVTANIVDANVTTAKIADANITTAKILDANVTAGKLASDSVTTAKILDANVTAGKLADDAVTTAKILDGAVTGAKLAGGAGGWSVTAVTTTYAASAGQFLVATGGTGYTVSLPASPSTGDRVAVYLNTITASYALTISSGSETFSPAISTNAANTEIKLWIAGDRVELIFDGTRWSAISREYVSPGTPDAVIEDQKSSGTNGGGTTASTWHTRDLQTLTRNKGSVISLSSDQFTPSQDGWVEWDTVSRLALEARTRLYNVTDTSVAGYGVSQEGYAYYFNQGLTGGCAVVAGKAYALQLRTGATYGYGMGYRSGTGTTEIYSRVRYWRD